MSKRSTAAVLVLLSAAAGSCKKATDPTPAPVPGFTVTITSTGASPKSLEVPLGSRILFINDDNRDHNMGSDPHPDHNECPPLNQVGLLRPGQRRETGNLVVLRTCGYHDHDLPNLTSLWGTITTK